LDGNISSIASAKIAPLNAPWKMAGALSKRRLPQQNRLRQENLCHCLRLQEVGCAIALQDRARLPIILRALRSLSNITRWIEIAEIEIALLDHPAIKQAIVVPREDYADDQRLAAYLVAATWPAPAMSELRSFLKETLPDYMIPSTWMFMEALPLAPNGKLDRQGYRRRLLPPGLSWTPRS
jgi:hypothetical protein